MYKTLISIIIFMLGLYFIFNIDNSEIITHPSNIENFESSNDDEKNLNEKHKCPDLLIQKGDMFYLYNTKLSLVPGVNPVTFDSLEDYSEFLQWQRSQNIRCPVLYLRESYDTQGEQTFNIHPSPTDLQGGLNKQIIVDGKTDMVELPTDIHSHITNNTVGDKKHFSKLIDAGRTDPSYNNNMYAGFDKDNLYIGIETPLDKMYYENDNLSTNPMDPNWGGRDYTQDSFKTSPPANINMLKFKRDMIHNTNKEITDRVKEVVIIDNWGE